jgi:hypothetical protein
MVILEVSAIRDFQHVVLSTNASNASVGPNSVCGNSAQTVSRFCKIIQNPEKHPGKREKKQGPRLLTSDSNSETQMPREKLKVEKLNQITTKKA